ncbi:EamA family transporter [Candidatus Uhrbacteria bacterium]|nr:EamA family transporter [Candidatus Uhrbacteria bacterium]MBD3284544.1 EamA family transporter [Candidatus Uhrbacteria bacterium]
MFMWTIYALLAAITAALMTIVGKIGLEKVDPTLATGVRSAFMFLFMFLVILIGGKLKGITTLDRHALLAIIMSAVFGALSWLFYFLALKDGAASRVAAIDRTSVVFIILLSIFFLAEKLTLKVAIGGVLVTIGAILVAL